MARFSARSGRFIWCRAAARRLASISITFPLTIYKIQRASSGKLGSIPGITIIRRIEVAIFSESYRTKKPRL
jgi:hypothetical protein